MSFVSGSGVCCVALAWEAGSAIFHAREQGGYEMKKIVISKNYTFYVN
jgi:hypothetical protein